LHCRILVNGKKIETSLGIKLKEEEWNDKKEAHTVLDRAGTCKP